MAKSKGLNTRVYVATDAIDGTYNEVLQINDVSHPMSASNEDVSTFGTTFVERLQTIKDSTFSLSGFLDNTDTTGQIVIRDAMLNDTDLFFKVLYDGVSASKYGYAQQVVVSSFEISSAVDGVLEVSIELEGTGGVTAVTA